MTDLLLADSPFFYILISNVVAFITYFGVTFFFTKYYYQWQSQSMDQWKCQPDKILSSKIIYRDLKLGSFNLILLSTLSGLFIYYLVLPGFSAIYFNFSEHGMIFSIFSAVFYLLWIDFSLYWAHRFFHRPLLFRKIHRLHHRTTAPIAINAFAMHPIEGLIYHFLTIGPLLFIPVHYIAAIIMVLYTYYVSLLDHSGVKLYSIFFWQSPSQFHDDHHKYFHVNYGQTFWFWDRMFGSWRKNNKIYGPSYFEKKDNFTFFLTNNENYINYD